MQWHRMAMAALVWLWVAACGGPGASGAGEAERLAPDADSDVITAAELRAATGSNLYDYIRARRPNWLRRTQARTLRPDRATGLVVYVDRVRFGDIRSLRQITLTQAVSVQYLGPSEAEAEFGPGHLNGAIHVLTR